MADPRVRAALTVFAMSACGGTHPPPIDVSAGRLTAQIYPDPAQITLLLDGKVVWQTEAGGDDARPPHGFAAISSKSVTITEDFGSFKFVEVPAQTTWQTIDRLTAVMPTDSGASFELRSGDRKLGTGALVFDGTLRSGANPDAAGYAQHVEITLTADSGDSVSLATPSPSTEHFVGLGGQSFDVDHRGQHVPLWVQEDGIGKYPDPDDDYQGVWFLTGRRHSTHTPMPMVVSSRGYALAVDTDARTVFDLAQERPDAARFEAWQRELDLHVFIGDGARDQPNAGAAARDALGYMIAWVGKPARPPITVFAPWVDAIFGSANVRAIAQQLRTAGVSASVIWTEDWRGGGDTSTGYALQENWQVSRALYPDFEQLASDLHGEGYQFLVYNNTFLDATGDVYAEATNAGYAIHVANDPNNATYSFSGVTLGPSSMLDLTNPAAVSWASGVMGEAIALGADGWMADFGEWLPIDAQLASGASALLAHNHEPVAWAQFNRALLASATAGRPSPLYFMRSAWLHSQPELQVLWLGDQQTDWSDGDGFPSVIPMAIGLGLTGFPYVGSDIGGYMSEGTTPTSDELFFRWVTLGALSPVMRTHHGRSARQNYQWNHDAGSIAHFRRWTRLHQQLAAYLSGSIASFDRDGVPLVRLTALEFPDEDWAWSTLDQYLLGDRILVAPVIAQGATSRMVSLPAATSWYPLLGGPAVNGAITATAAVTEIPAFVPAGSAVCHSRSPVALSYANRCAEPGMPAPPITESLLSPRNSSVLVTSGTGRPMVPSAGRFNDCSNGWLRGPSPFATTHS